MSVVIMGACVLRKQCGVDTSSTLSFRINSSTLMRFATFIVLHLLDIIKVIDLFRVAIMLLTLLFLKILHVYIELVPVTQFCFQNLHFLLYLDSPNFKVYCNSVTNKFNQNAYTFDALMATKQHNYGVN